MNSRGDLRKEGEVGYYNDRNTLLVNHPRLIRNWVQRNNHEQSWNRKRSEFGSSHMGIEVADFEMPMGDFNSSLKPRSMLDQWDGETDEPVAFRRKRFPIPYADEGPSNHQRGFLHGYAEQKRIHHDYDGPSRVDILENERVELIRKVDALKDQIIRCGDLGHFTEKPRERLSPPPPVLPNNYFGDDAYVQVSPTRFNIVSIQPFAPDKYIPEPLYFSPNNQPVRRTNRSGLDEQDFSSRLTEISNEIVVYDSSNLPQRPRKPPHQPPAGYLMQPYHDHFSGQHMACNRSTLASRQHATFSPQIACSCLQCYDMNRKFPPQVPPKLYNSRDSNWSPESSVIQNPKTRSSIDLGMGGVAHRNPTRVVAAHGSERACHPVLGGAPFLTCCSCFGLLKLPRKLVLKGKNQQKVRCGACSAILLVDFEKKRVIVTVSKLPEQVSAEGDDGSGEKLSENLQSSQNHSNAGAMDSWSDEFDNSGYKFPLTDTEVTKPNVYSSYQSLNFVESIVRKEPLSSTSSFPEDEHSPYTLIFQRKISISSTVPLKDDVPLPFPDSPDQNESKNDSSSNVVSRCEDQEKVILNGSTSQQNSVEDVSVATRIEVPSRELLNSSILQDSAVVRKEEGHPTFSRQSAETERSDDYCNSDYKSRLTDTEVTEANVSSSDQRENFVESIERKEPLSSTSRFPEDEHSPETIIFPRNISFSSDVPTKDDEPSLLSDSLDQKEPHNDSSSDAVSSYEDQQKVVLYRSTLQQNSVEDVSVATEIEVPSQELLDSSMSQDSAVVRKEEDHPRINKLVSNASTVYYSFSSRSVETESSDDSGNSDYESQLTDSKVTEANVLSSDQSQNFAESIERKELLSSTSSFSKDEHSPDNVIFQRDISFSSYATQKDDGPLPLSDSLDHNEPNNYFSSNVVSSYEDQQKAILNRSTPQQNSVEDVLVETEIEVPSQKLLDSSVPQDSAAVRKEEDCPRINKLVSNASTVYFSCSSRSVETERPNVFVNGQPISDRTVKKAENLAGPIEPGNYWYDYQGGFWGVMGQPCLGIIPPFIEELKYPMPEDCAAGNTGVFVNGRELNQKDLDLLACRGLATTRDRYYVIEICGTVLDENTGEKLHSLGKLAPTVRRTKHGFGMKTPRALAQ
ncbi:hypothetical protein RHGRI_005980 [Rhododendron griersonianum]|uniref:Probable zinc-ribbon domain-containing protein n=1 Tax=Rhododendron griersonianum TaxID=479676 RepID=A0AAV6LEL6_9ERIC|nr:hypothetical protein RHGRI_005980 [Rhododendron griersonianum]